MTAKRILSLLVRDEPGVLQRVCGLLSRRGCNIDSITVGGSEAPLLARMTIVIHADDAGLAHICRQLDKLIDVLQVTPLDPRHTVSRELALIRVAAPPGKRAELTALVDIFRGQIVDVSPDSVIVQAAGDPEKLEALLRLLSTYGVQELARTGVTSLSRSGSSS